MIKPKITLGPKAAPAPKTAAASKTPPASKAAAPAAMTEGQRAYEAKRAAKAGVSLEKWLDMKERDRVAEAKAREKEAAVKAEPPKKPGLISRLLDRAHKPL